MTLASDLVADTRRHLESHRRQPLNQLAADVNASAMSFEFTHDISQIQQGSYLEIDLEIVYVWSVDQSARTASVQRAQAGSTASSHLSGAMVTVDPTFSDFAIFKALNDEIRSLSSPANGLFAVRTLDLTADGSTGWYDLTGASDVQDILSVRHEVFGTDQWVPLTNYELGNNAGAGFASGSALRITDGLVSGRTVRVLYKAGFDVLDALTDDVEDVTGMPESMHDIPPLGAAVRLVAPREVQRNQTGTQGDSRRAEEVPAGAVVASSRGLALQRQTRINDEVSRLMQLHPDRGFIPSPSPSSVYANRW